MLKPGVIRRVTLGRRRVQTLDKKVRIMPLSGYYSPFYAKERYGSNVNNFAYGYDNTEMKRSFARWITGPQANYGEKRYGEGSLFDDPNVPEFRPASTMEKQLLHSVRNARVANGILNQTYEMIGSYALPRNFSTAEFPLNTEKEIWSPTLLNKDNILRYGNKRGLLFLSSTSRTVNYLAPLTFSGYIHSYYERALRDLTPRGFRSVFNKIRSFCVGRKVLVGGRDKPTNLPSEVFIDDIILYRGLIDQYSDISSVVPEVAALEIKAAEIEGEDVLGATEGTPVKLLDALDYHLGMMIFLKDKHGNILDLQEPVNVSNYTLNSKMNVSMRNLINNPDLYFGDQVRSQWNNNYSGVNTRFTLLIDGRRGNLNPEERLDRAMFFNRNTYEMSQFMSESLKLSGADITMDVITEPGSIAETGPNVDETHNIEITQIQLQAYDPARELEFRSRPPIGGNIATNEFAYSSSKRDGAEYISFRLLNHDSSEPSQNLDGLWNIDGNAYRTWFVGLLPNDDVPHITVRRDYLNL